MYSYLHILFSMEFNLVSSLFRFDRLEFSTLLRFSCHVSSIFVMNVYETSRLRTLYLVIVTTYLTHSTPLPEEAMIIRSPLPLLHHTI